MLRIYFFWLKKMKEEVCYEKKKNCRRPRYSELQKHCYCPITHESFQAFFLLHCSIFNKKVSHRKVVAASLHKTQFNEANVE